MTDGGGGDVEGLRSSGRFGQEGGGAFGVTDHLQGTVAVPGFGGGVRDGAQHLRERCGLGGGGQAGGLDLGCGVESDALRRGCPVLVAQDDAEDSGRGSTGEWVTGEASVGVGAVGGDPARAVAADFRQGLGGQVVAGGEAGVASSNPIGGTGLGGCQKVGEGAHEVGVGATVEEGARRPVLAPQPGRGRRVSGRGQQSQGVVEAVERGERHSETGGEE
ncbi:hypothetical protein ACF1A9_20165 [Streptomyces sp. NPDC014872]|uniref:hypothetical protein n=1 Tax=Streptomyces sp. NPDC014872 TaxID=3364926 RepID=UPI0036FAA2E7